MKFSYAVKTLAQIRKLFKYVSDITVIVLTRDFTTKLNRSHFCVFRLRFSKMRHKDLCRIK